MTRAVVLFGLAGVLAGCAGSNSRQLDRHAIVEALQRSPVTYLHFRDPVWWGRRVAIRVVSVRGEDGWALALLRAPVSRLPRQWVLLHHLGSWRVAGATVTSAKSLPCAGAPGEIMRRLVGGCSAVDVSSPATIVGPRAVRLPTRAEQVALVSAANRAIFQGRDACVRYRFRVSRVDSRFASGEYSFEKPYRNCLVGNGVSIYERTGSAWRDIGAASEPFPCTFAPPGVVRSLYAICRGDEPGR